MKKRWRDFPEPRRWLYLLTALLAFTGIGLICKAIQAFLNPMPAFVQSPPWYEQLLDAVFDGTVVIGCLSYDRKRLLSESGKISPLSKKWRDKFELRSILYASAIVQFIGVPIATIKAWRAIHDPTWPPFGDTFWSVFHGDTLFMAAIGIAIIVYDRRRIRREKKVDLSMCSHCGYDLRATPDRCPECGTIKAKLNVQAELGRI